MWWTVAFEFVKSAAWKVWHDWPTYLYWSAGIPAGAAVLNVLQGDFGSAFKWGVAALSIVGARQLVIDGMGLLVSKMLSSK